LDEADEKYILRILEVSHVKSVKKGKQVSFIDGALVMKERVYEKCKGWFIKPSTKVREIFENSIVLMLPKDFALVYDKQESLSEVFRMFCVKVKNKTDLDAQDLNDGDSMKPLY
jgi:hypothetical protein